MAKKSPAAVVVAPDKRTFTRPEAAEYLGMKPQTLAAWASHGRGPKYLKLGRSVRYRVADLDDFERRRECGGDTIAD